MLPFLPISETASFLGVCPKTLRRWDSAHRLPPAFRTFGGHRRYDYALIKTLHAPPHSPPSPPPPPTPPARAIAYARVSSVLQRQRGDLQRQATALAGFCDTQHYTLVRTIQDVGSGLNDSRKGLHQLIRAVSHGHCDTVVVAYPDRLARFGINVLKACFAEWGVMLQLAQPPTLGESSESTLIADITAILYSYMGKLYRLRRRPLPPEPTEIR